MYYGSVFVVVYKQFYRSLQVGSSDTTCVQSFRSVYTSYGFWIQTEGEELEKWTFPTSPIIISGPILTKFCVDIYINPSINF